MSEELERIAKFYRLLLVEYTGFYRAPKDGDNVFWKKLSEYCAKEDLDPLLLMVAHFDFHKKYYNSYPYPNQLYNVHSPQRYQNFVEGLLKKYPGGEVPYRVLFKTLSIVHEVENDCYRIRAIAKETLLSRKDAAISIYKELSPYTRLVDPHLVDWLKLVKPTINKDCIEAQKMLYKSRGLKSLILEVLNRELYGSRKISIRSRFSEQDIGSVSQRD